MAFRGGSGISGARAYQDTLYAKAKADPKLGSFPVLNYTNWPPTGGRADAINVHTYGKFSFDTRKRISRDLGLAAAALPETLPRYITETGYPTSLEQTKLPCVRPDQQTDLILISLLEAFHLGVRRTYIYEFFDECGPEEEKPEGHYGLFDIKGRPKPVAVALCAIKTSLVQVQNTSSNGVADLIVQVDGASGLLLRGRSGAAVLFIWKPNGFVPRVKVILSRS